MTRIFQILLILSTLGTSWLCMKRGTTYVPGFLLWNGLGRHFGLGTGDIAVNKTHALSLSLLFVLLVLAEILLFD